MRLLIKSIIYFIIPVILFGISSEFLLRHIPNHYAYKKDYLDKNSGSIEVLILGSSHSYLAIDPAYLKLKSFNAANPEQTLNFDAAILKKYGERLTNLKYIVIPVSYPSLIASLEKSVEARRVCYYILYYDLNVPHKLINYSLMLSLNFRSNLNRMVVYYLLKNYDPGCSKLGWGKKEQEDLYETGESHAKIGTVKDVPIDNNVNILKSMINYAKARNIKVLLFMPPAFHTYVENLDSTQLKQTIDASLGLEKYSPNVKYVNFLTDSSFTERDFCDADHLNEYGARKLTLKMDSIITSLENKEH